ncbi:MAG: aldolase/citrate lyase family protein [Alphaproteobacteria bacterium]
MSNVLQNALERRRVLIGTIVSVNSCEQVEALSASGLDWLFFDLEHAAFSVGDVQRMIQAVRPPCLSFIRIQEPEAAYVKKALDTGCNGIIVPQVNSAAAARHIVEAGKYAPLGSRSVGLSRSTGYGANLAQAIASHNDEKSIIVQIEHADAVKNLDEILSVPGVDGVFVGPYDLSASMGMIGQVGSAEVQNAITLVAASAKKRNMISGIFIGTDAALEKEIGRGFQFIAVGSDILRAVASCKATAEAAAKA